MEHFQQPTNLRFDLDRYRWRTVERAIISILSVSQDPGLAKAMMLEAIRYAAADSLRPTIGCVIASGDTIVSRGRRSITPNPTMPGQVIIKHAEQTALAELPNGVKNLTAYTTLEPCWQRGKRNYADANIPCADRLISAGIARVVIGCPDADERTRGKGMRRLVEAGIVVERASVELEDDLILLLGDGDFRIR